LKSHSRLGILAYFNAYALAQGTRGQLLQAIPMKLCRGQTYGMPPSESALECVFLWPSKGLQNGSIL